MKAIEQKFSVVLFTMLYKVVLIETLWMSWYVITQMEGRVGLRGLLEFGHFTLLSYKGGGGGGAKKCSKI